MVSIDIPKRQLDRLDQAIAGTGRKIRREIATAVNATAKKSRGVINKQIRTELATKKAAVDRVVAVTRKASNQSESPTAAVTLSKTARISLKEFGARQTRAGSSYRISKSTGRNTAQGAFMGPRPGATSVRLKGHVFKRQGKSRLPIRKLWGPSPWGVFVGKNMQGPTMKETRNELEKQIERRIRFVTLKAQGKI